MQIFLAVLLSKAFYTSFYVYFLVALYSDASRLDNAQSKTKKKRSEQRNTINPSEAFGVMRTCKILNSEDTLLNLYKP